jgi:hypothetical protein
MFLSAASWAFWPRPEMSSNKIFGAREDAEFHAHRIDITTGVITITIIVAVAHITAADRVGRFRAETVRPTEDTGYFRDVA